jgi:hypothetical protein
MSQAADYGSSSATLQSRVRTTRPGQLPPECVLVLVLPFPPLALAPAAAFASHAAVVWVTVAGCAGRTRGVNQDFPP